MAKKDWTEYIQKWVDNNGGYITQKSAGVIYDELKGELPPKPLPGRDIYDMSLNLEHACQTYLPES